ncbi:APC family permease [Pseudalkalibacillus hwajinpoensis]|uniref:Amino acid permease n=1 Tax=Guptibacillus hwajinpoensis TaxID=208199 RepID=A0A4U1MJ62_9BACL|nr:APC family permease [Pseudalkalibacillus hwajinpoensis]TKD70847.1 amino acid permease [Pseudalkalibacillus hwajinpoensis]
MAVEEKKLKKVLSKFDLLFLALGAMLGWGWVVLSGTWITSAGSFGAVLAFAIGGFLVICVGLNYAELASAMPRVGGEHEYVHRALGENASFVASWAITLGYVSVATFEAVALPTVIDFLLPDYQAGYLWTIAGWDVHLNWVLIGSVGAVIITFINYLGLKQAAVLQTVFTLVIVAAGLLLIFGAGVNGEPANLTPHFIGGMGGVMAVLVMVPFLFVGFDVIPQVAEEANLPQAQIGKFLVISVIGAILFYIAIAIGVSLGMNQEQLGTTELATADAMGNLFGSAMFAKLLILGGVAGIITSWNSFVIGGSRVLYAMAKSGMLPSWFGRLHPKHHTPSNAVLFIGVLSMLAPLLGRSALVWIVDAGGLGIVVAYFLVAWSFIKLRKNEPDMERPFRAGKSPIFGYLALVLSFGFIALYFPGMPAALIWPYEWVMVGGWFLIGLYFFVRMRKGVYKESGVGM